MSLDEEFYVCTTGTIDYAEFYEIDNAYCKYGYHSGNEWTVVGGIEEGLTQMSNCSNDVRRLAVWNFPLDISFRSTNPHGCKKSLELMEFPDCSFPGVIFRVEPHPVQLRGLRIIDSGVERPNVSSNLLSSIAGPQLVLSIYGMDLLGHDVIRGYGVCHLPLTTGRHEKKVSVYALESSSTMQKIAAWLTGRRPELIEPSILASAAGRELTRMRMQGSITITFNVVLKDFAKLGYDNGERHK